MANNFVNGRDEIISIDPANGSAYKLVVCLTSNTLTESMTELDATSKCGNQFVQGYKFEGTISGDGFVIDPDTGTPTNQGFPELYTLFTARTMVTIKFGKAVPTTGEAMYTGSAFITKLDKVAGDDAIVKFNVTFRAANPPFAQTITY